MEMAPRAQLPEGSPRRAITEDDTSHEPSQLKTKGREQRDEGEMMIGGWKEEGKGREGKEKQGR